MLNPFPGMNPYLETPRLWTQVHNRLIVAIADFLTEQIAPKYIVSIEERIYTTDHDSYSVVLADVAVSHLNMDKNKPTPTSSNTTILTPPQPIQVTVPIPLKIKELYLEIKLIEPNQLITVIEILSPTNKRSKSGLQAYEYKRNKILTSSTHLVEIDLLRGGTPMNIIPDDLGDYRILISRGYSRPNASLYSFRLPDPIPCVPIPLLLDDPEPILDLQTLLNSIYQKARLDLANPPEAPQLNVVIRISVG